MTDRSWALSEVAAIVRGRLVGPDVRVTGVSTDSRISAPGALFFALSGPSFDGHHQPHLPGELGFYDLRLRETRFRQFRLAEEHGIDAFVRPNGF